MQQRIEEIAKKIQGCNIDNQRIFMFFQQLRKQQKHYNDFEYVGNGSFALVIKAFNKNSQKQVALKIVLCNQNEPNEAESVLKEYNLLLKSKNCPYLVGVNNQFYVYEEKIVLEDSDEEEQIDEKPKKQNEKVKSFLVLELEYCNGKDYQAILLLYFSKKVDKNANYYEYYHQFKRMVKFQLYDCKCHLNKCVNLKELDFSTLILMGTLKYFDVK